MIYMVDHVFADPATEPEWHAWYAGYLQKLIAVPGIRSAQRFKAFGCSPSRYLAMYTVDSADVYDSAPYRNMGGGGSQSARFHGAYQLWTRNLFSGVSSDANVAAPRVTTGQRVLVFDRDELPPRRDRDNDRRRGGPNDAYRLDERVMWLESIGLHMTTKYRGFVVLDADEAAEAASAGGSFLYEPFTAFIS